MPVPYESTGRTRQKQRTRDALVEAARSLLEGGQTPAVEQAADAAGISRTTAYRYFPNQRQLLLAAIPDIDRPSLLGEEAPDEAGARLDLVIAGQVAILRRWEPQLRAALRLSLDQEPRTPRDARPVLRQGRAIAWIEDALAPLARTHPALDRRRLAVAIRAGCGIESWIWMVDIAAVSRKEAAALMRESAQALLAAALARHGE
ncbi:TetR/AcrR family transcriptional regulator [Amycolatopsis alkalitolerans]|uniref:TetR family transcriptional regulator n=1 Tax=Amycolatopsis alkalitolerans TaxID=2547244 RepID=A0A5C4LYL6_9PSEU|nr:TetR/AcrR family transcriptional regulator [Amycolatopsis alkalitolerans]TNC22193.1 TetR family transcriptional regulator [Amycolatopsis alkalitolerans]